MVGTPLMAVPILPLSVVSDKVGVMMLPPNVVMLPVLTSPLLSEVDRATEVVPVIFD